MRDVSSAYPSVTAGLARAAQPPPFDGGYPNPCSIVVGIRGIPISSRIKRAPLPLWGLTLYPSSPRLAPSHSLPVNSLDLSLSLYLVNRHLSVRPSIRLAIWALYIYLSFRLNHYTLSRIRVLRLDLAYTCCACTISGACARNVCIASRILELAGHLISVRARRVV